MPCRRDHPRSRGGNPAAVRSARPSVGPSPLARGKHALHGLQNRILGTIPARAGETLTGMLAAHRSRDHPRSRGGNNEQTTSFLSDKGPSPLARGKLFGSGAVTPRSGTIPARAGETSRRYRLRSRAQDHPRSRGGNTSSCAPSVSTKGPSPLARGKHGTIYGVPYMRRTIPARAGETCCG